MYRFTDQMTPDMDNIDVINEFLEMRTESNFHQYVNKPIGFRDNNTPLILNLIFSIDKNLITQFDCLAPVGESDHIIALAATLQLDVCGPKALNTTRVPGYLLYFIKDVPLQVLLFP